MQNLRPHDLKLTWIADELNLEFGVQAVRHLHFVGVAAFRRPAARKRCRARFSCSRWRRRHVRLIRSRRWRLLL